VGDFTEKHLLIGLGAVFVGYIAILASFVNFLPPPRRFREGWGGVKNLRLLQGLLQYRYFVGRNPGACLLIFADN
jgi:hypothetical protein